LAVEDSYFLFDNNLYKQIDGMAMGSPLGPLFANIFLSHYESIWLKDSPVKPVLYKRYVDDTLWLLPANSNVSDLMSYMNSRHNNMRFTFETETNNSINFIGLNIMHHEYDSSKHCYTTNVYRKPTATQLCMNFNSFVSISYRLSVLKCLLYRAFRICSNWQLIHTEISFIRSMLLRNAYPGWLIDRVIKNAVTHFVNPVLKYGPRKEAVYIGLPFLGKSTDSLRATILRIGKQFIPHKDIIIYYKPGKRSSNFFHNKDVTPTALRSHVVYEYLCTQCNLGYIGQTVRHLRHRVAEHAGVSHLTGNPVKSVVHSKIRDHCGLCQNSSCDLSNFNILATGSSDIELLVKERLLIDQKKPLLNGNVGSLDLLLF